MDSGHKCLPLISHDTAVRFFGTSSRDLPIAKTLGRPAPLPPAFIPLVLFFRHVVVRILNSLDHILRDFNTFLKIHKVRGASSALNLLSPTLLRHSGKGMNRRSLSLTLLSPKSVFHEHGMFGQPLILPFTEGIPRLQSLGPRLTLYSLSS